MKKIIVVTRRENNDIDSQNTLGYIDNETKSKYDIHSLPENGKLFDFWSSKLCSGWDSLKDGNDLKDKLNALNKKFPEYLSINIDYCLNIYELKRSDIFVYHQWLDKQGLEEPFAETINLHFLSALKQDILEIKQNENDEEYEFNWLIHDTDLLPPNYDGLVKFGDKNYKEADIPKDLKQDNIWCFIHDATTSKYYKYYILDFFNNSEIQTAGDFYNRIAYEKDACKQRIELLQLLGLTENTQVSTEEKRFIFQNEAWAKEDKLTKNATDIEMKTIKGINDFLQ